MIALYLSMIDEDLQKNKFEDMYYRYRNLMYHIAFQVVNNKRDAEDAVQEALFRVAKNMDKIGDVKSNETKNFVAIITKREAIKLYDKRKKRKEVFETELDDDGQDRKSTFFEKHKVEGSDEIISELEWAIAELPFKYSSLLTLKYVMGFSGKEISQITGISEANVRQQIFKGRRLLKKMLMEEWR